MLNQNPNTFTFNGHSSDEFGIRIEKKPDLNRSARKFKSASVAGRNGNIYQMQDAWDEVVVSYSIYAGGRDKGDAIPAFTDIMEWLNSADDYAVLTDSYDPEHYRMAVFVDAVDIESQWHTIGKATVRFRCRPQRYLMHGMNIMPQLPEVTRQGTGITLVVDSNGVVSLSGRSTSPNTWGSNINLDNPLTFTTAMVGETIYLNNTNALNVSVRFIENGSVFLEIPLDTIDKTAEVTQEMVGHTLETIRVWYQPYAQVGGTFKPELRFESRIIEPSSGDVIDNPTNHISHPIITLTGQTIVPSLLNLEAPYNISSDFETTKWNPAWLSNIAFMTAEGYTLSGVYTYRINTATQATASSEGDILTSHVNSTGTLTFTSNTGRGVGFGITLTPDSDYRLMYTGSDDSIHSVKVVFFESDGEKSYNSHIQNRFDYSGVRAFTFHVPSNCSNALIIFYTNPPSTFTFSGIMLSSGTEYVPFSPYLATDYTESVTINDTVLSFTTRGFGTAVIDCERENFTVDGINYNTKSIVTDQNGNISPEYLRFVEGENTISFTNNVITAVSIDPRFWEL